MSWFWKRKQKMLLSLNRISWMKLFVTKSHWGVNNLWGLWHFYYKSLFIDNLCVWIFHFYYLGNDTLNDELYLSQKIKKVWSNLQKYPYPPHGRLTKLPMGRGVSKAKFFKGKYDTLTWISGGVGLKQKILPWKVWMFSRTTQFTQVNSIQSEFFS